MSVLLALPPSIAMRSAPTSIHADYKTKHRGKKPSVVQSTRLPNSPRLLRRPLGGRIVRPQSTSPLPLSIRNQQILWEAVTDQTWQLQDVEPPPEEVQSLLFITPQSPVPSVTPSSPAVNLETVSAAVTPVYTAAELVDDQNLLRYFIVHPKKPTPFDNR
jgi:hypothetical protein